MSSVNTTHSLVMEKGVLVRVTCCTAVFRFIYTPVVGPMVSVNATQSLIVEEVALVFNTGYLPAVQQFSASYIYTPVVGPTVSLVLGEARVIAAETCRTPQAARRGLIMLWKSHVWFIDDPPLPPLILAARALTHRYFDGEDEASVIEDGDEMQDLLGGIDWGSNTLSA